MLSLSGWLLAPNSRKHRPPHLSPPGWEWETPSSLWARIHIDFAGPFQGQVFLVVADTYSKWLEIALMPSTILEAIIWVLRKLFAIHGLPDLLVLDNRPQLMSNVFEGFLAGLGISLFHLASNDWVEHMVHSSKEALSKMGPGGWQERIDQFLLVQHSMPCPLTNKSPEELLMGRRLSTTLDRVHPSYAPERPLDSTRGPWAFFLGDSVYARNFVGNPLWLPGRVAGITGPCSYRVELTDGRVGGVTSIKAVATGDRQHPPPNQSGFHQRLHPPPCLQRRPGLNPKLTLVAAPTTMREEWTYLKKQASFLQRHHRSGPKSEDPPGSSIPGPAAPSAGTELWRFGRVWH